ncbi:MAG: dephospho-CoA kinase [Bdellovibrionales bacterium]|nr:dephospho-CoA kinase [Bdellovibrionales bacterium]
MIWIGLTGGIASGKSTVSQILRQRGLPVVDADELARDAIIHGSEGYKNVVKAFGMDVLNKDGTLNRESLAEIVFTDKSQLEKLESIIHPIVREQTKKLKDSLKSQGYKMAFYDVPLLFEKNMESMFDKIVVVYSRMDQQIERLKSRNNMSKEQAVNRILNQVSMDDKIKKCDFVVDNTSDHENLENQITKLLEDLNDQS